MNADLPSISCSCWQPLCFIVLKVLSKQRNLRCVLKRLQGISQENTRPSEHPSLRTTIPQNTVPQNTIPQENTHPSEHPGSFDYLLLYKSFIFFVYVLWEARQSQQHESVLEPRAAAASPEGSQVSTEESKEEWEPSDVAAGSWPQILSEQCLLSANEPSLQPHLERFVKSSAVACGILREGLILRNLSI